MSLEQIKTVKRQVLYILSVSEKARNSDTFLTNAIWVRFYSSYLRNVDNEWVLPLKYNGQVASRDDIKRARAHIQNKEKRYPPTIWEVAKKRKWKEEEWRKVLGYNPEFRTI